MTAGLIVLDMACFTLSKAGTGPKVMWSRAYYDLDDDASNGRKGPCLHHILC